MVWWIIGLIGTLFGIGGTALLFVSLQRLTGDIKKSMQYLLIAATVYAFHQTLVLVFAWNGVTPDWWGWYTVPVLYPVAGVPFAIGMYKLLTVTKRMRER